MAPPLSSNPVVSIPPQSVSPETVGNSSSASPTDSATANTQETTQKTTQPSKQAPNQASVIMPPRPVGNGQGASDGRPSTSSSATSSLNFMAEPFKPAEAAGAETQAADLRAPIPWPAKKKKRNKSKSKQRSNKSDEVTPPVDEATAELDPIHGESGVIVDQYAHVGVNAEGLASVKYLRGLPDPTSCIRVVAPFGSDFFKEHVVAQDGSKVYGTFHHTRRTDAWHEHVRLRGHWIGPFVNPDGTTEVLICSDSIGYADTLKFSFASCEEVDTVDFITRATYEGVDENIANVPSSDGHVLVTANFLAESMPKDAQQVADRVQDAITRGLDAYHTITGQNDDVRQYPSVIRHTRLGWSNGGIMFRFELDKTSDATYLIDASFGGQIQVSDDLVLTIKPKTLSSLSADAVGQHHVAAFSMMQNADNLGHMRQVSSDTFYSQTGRSGVMIDVWGEAVPIAGHVQAAMVPRRAENKDQSEPTSPDDEAAATTTSPQADAPAGDKATRPKMRKPSLTWSAQTVLAEKIRRGLDLRTTLMIRNTPTKWFAEDARRMLDLTHKGLYDFTYTRIDLKRMQAVGYVFVNFISAEALKTWVEHWVPENKPALHLPNNTSKPPGEYNKYHKAVAVNYANIQGLECLEAKFRNSCMLNEAPQCRPKLWYSNESADENHPVGTEREWPAPDNNAKLQRSMENALYQGLYAPRDRTRDQTRRTQSRFDRGTTRHTRDENTQNQPHRGQVALPTPNNVAAPWQMQQVQQYVPEHASAAVGQYTGFQHQVPLPGGPSQMYNAYGGFNNFNGPTSFNNGFQGYNGGPVQQFPMGYGPQQMHHQMPMTYHGAYNGAYNNGYMGPPASPYPGGPPMMFHGQQQQPPVPSWMTQYNVVPPRRPAHGAMLRTQTGGRLGNHINIVPDPKRAQRDSTKGEGKTGAKNA